MFFSAAICALIYNFMGGIKSEDTFSLNGIKIGGSLGAFLFCLWFLNGIFEKQINDHLQVENILKNNHQELKIKNNFLSLGTIKSSELNNLGFYYVDSQDVVNALATLKDKDPSRYENLVLSSIREQCKKRKGVCEYRFNVKVVLKEEPKGDPMTLRGKAGVCFNSSEFWTNNEEVLLNSQINPDQSIRIKVEDMNMSCDDKPQSPRKIYLFSSKDAKQLGLDSSNNILEAQFVP